MLSRPYRRRPVQRMGRPRRRARPEGGERRAERVPGVGAATRPSGASAAACGVARALSAWRVCARARAQEMSGDDKVFFQACRDGKVDEARRLGTPARARLVDGDGYSPLHEACLHGHGAIVRLLLDELGADVGAKTNDGRTPAQLLQEHARDHQLDQQALRSKMACLVRRAQGPLLCTTDMVVVPK